MDRLSVGEERLSGVFLRLNTLFWSCFLIEFGEKVVVASSSTWFARIQLFFVLSEDLDSWGMPGMTGTGKNELYKWG